MSLPSNPYDFLRTLIDYAAVIRGIDKRVWEAPVDADDPVNDIWIKNSWMRESGNGFVLTEDGQFLLDLEPLLRYEANAFPKHINPPTSNRCLTNPNDYALLRRGLKAIAEKTNKEMWKMLGLVNPKSTHRLCDIAGGTGYYADMFLRDNPNGSATVIDRPDVIENIIPDPSIMNRIKYVGMDMLTATSHDIIQRHGNHEIVLLSEILHCKSRATMQRLIHIAGDVLSLGGVLIVNEQHADPRFDWRMRLFANGKSMSPHDVIDVVSCDPRLSHDRAITTPTHHMQAFVKSCE